jgi:FixJ family two-component response regulator
VGSKPIVLCVDDERNVVESLQLNLRQRYDVRTALSGAQGLELLRKEAEVAVVLSDMRMPEMDGAAFLAEVRKQAPDAVRILLTGFADVEAAVRAVNEGQIFRFLTKPCSPEHLGAALSAAVEQHRLITAEKVLLQKTLIGSVKALIEVLALSNPLALGRAVRIRDRARKVLHALALENQWQVEFAAMLSQLAGASLPDDTARKLYDGEQLTAVERKKVVDSMGAINGILRNIPRLEPVTGLLDEMKQMMTMSAGGPKVGKASVEARLLQAVVDLDSLEAQGRSLRQSFESLTEREAVYGKDVLRALHAVANDPTEFNLTSVETDRLRHGMVLAEDLKTLAGVLILPRGFEINSGTLDHVLNFKKQLVPQLKVLTRSATPEAPAAKAAVEA